MKAIVTVRLPRNPKHNPYNKQTGVCPVSVCCTDVTGEHHSYIENGETIDEILEKARTRRFHITRVEVCELTPEKESGIKPLFGEKTR